MVEYLVSRLRTKYKIAVLSRGYKRKTRGYLLAGPDAFLEVAAEAGFDGAFTFVYSPRPGTEAAEHAERFVPREVAAALPGSLVASEGLVLEP